MRKTKTKRKRKMNHLGKARIKYYSIKKGGEGPHSNRSITPRSNRSRTPRSNRSRTSSRKYLESDRINILSVAAMAAAEKAVAEKAAAEKAVAEKAAAEKAAAREALMSRLTPTMRDIKAMVKYPKGSIVVGNTHAVQNKATRLRELAA